MCSWCINTALKYANPTSRTILDANCVRKDADAEARGKEVFHQLGLDKHYEEYGAQA
jgi:hypothetical protein